MSGAPGRLAWTIARRELRGGVAGFRVFLLCLMLGVAAITAVATVRAAITGALAEQGRVLLGGDAQVELTYRRASPEERIWMTARAERVSEVLEFRSMVRAGEEVALAQVKAVDSGWPLVGEALLDPPMTMARALAGPGAAPAAGSGGRPGTGPTSGPPETAPAPTDRFGQAPAGPAATETPAGPPGAALTPAPAGGAPADRMEPPGAVMERALADRLGLVPGDRFRLGDVEFRLSALLLREPDSTSGGFALAPRVLVATEAVEATALLSPGAMFEAEYRMILPPGHDLDAIRTRAEADIAGLRWQDSRRPAPGMERNVERIGAFLILMGLAGLAVGGVGIAAATRAWIGRKTATIATLKALGATGGEIRAAFGIQLAVLGAAGIAAGLVLGTAATLLAGPAIAAAMPVAIALRPSAAGMAEAAIYGALVAALAVLLPLAALAGVRPAVLYRDGGPGRRAWPPAGVIAWLAALALALAGAAAGFSGAPGLALGTLAGIAAALGLLRLAAAGLSRGARHLSGAGVLRGRPALRAALAALGAPGGETAAVVLSLGLGLSVLAAVGQVQANLSALVEEQLPERVPAYFVIDIQPDQIGPLTDRLAAMPQVTRVETAPMLRGVITRINGQDARAVAGDHWVLRGDRGLTYAARPPEGTRIVAGRWWPEDYAGPAEASLAAREAEELGLTLGDRLTVNVLGRDIEARITSLRDVDFRSGGLGFVLMMNPAALAGAPHSWIATVYTPPESESGVLRALAGAFPNITAIPVREALARLGEALDAIARASAIAAGVTLATGIVVLIGAAAAGERARAREAALLKVLGASRGMVLASFALRAALSGAAAGLVALAVGTGAGWVVMRFVMEAPYALAWGPALAVVLGGAGATLAAGLLFALRPLAARPAGILRAAD